MVKVSIGLIIKGPEGLVLAAESRITLETRNAQGVIINSVTYDNAHKVLCFGKQDSPHSYIGVVTYGLGGINLRSAHSFIPEFQSVLPDKRLTVEEFAKTLSDFFMHQWKNSNDPSPYQGPPMTFVIGGFNEGEPYGRVYSVSIPQTPIPIEQQPDAFGVTWGGQREIVDRLVSGYDARAIQLAQQTLGLNQDQVKKLTDALSSLQLNMPIALMPIQDCVDLAVLFIRTTIEGQRLTATIRGCGGPIDIACVTRNEGFRFVQKKEIKGELRNNNH